MEYDLYYLMTQAMMEAEQAFSSGEVPVGAVLADAEGRIVARAHNQPIALNDPTAHAEILVLRKAGVVGQNYRLAGSTLVVTIEPCLMCMGAAVNARIARLVFGAYDPKAGAAGSLYDVSRDDRLNHRIEVTAGIMEQECRALLRKFFRARRGN
ncbi:MAG: tRNA adenosine(34) deaminase TadA [Desulfobacteraceae bacterium]|nr:tRNA adenosine(34) deaminase TadA [Desulfobacterales bacterium]MBL6967599.1 tRNA adenosine(34) deaminase TadA [Desulfobacteraceae bacterium]MBL7101504.1 tRNA adenosine(34) deaminase TadA [Desulfobacteraceae bacterium]MBL7171361.1 tRNA adenosine(34) deaminase TadA [Desulfobacteraceae bacterium]MBU0734418.1 tRNA adenosine(34) deaminase TadA [Pseudomonadota bacterium]